MAQMHFRDVAGRATCGKKIVANYTADSHNVTCRNCRLTRAYLQARHLKWVEMIKTLAKGSPV